MQTVASPVSSFDFLNGAWHATERWLPRCGEGSEDWQQRSAYLVLRPLLGGLANAEEITYPDNPGFAIATFRCFDLPSRQWIIQSYVYGIDPAMPGLPAARGQLLPELRGGFSDGRGEFFGATDYDGRTVRVKYVWRDVTAISARWERWFSFDDGAAWEQNVDWTLARERTLA